jgi:hypothetical protein
MRRETTAELDDEALLDLVQRQTLRCFWDFAHPVSGLARERSNVTPRYGLEAVTTGGSGFGVMAIIVGVSRGWIPRGEAVARLSTMVRFLTKSDSYHGIWPHFLNGETGKTIPFSRKDDGGDLVETSFLLAGLLCARQYFDAADEAEARLRAAIDWLWREAEWDWHTRGGRNVLYWHWSPNNGWSMNHEIRGWNECLITYVLAASAPRYGISPEVYHRGWADGRDFLNGRSYDGVTLPLGPDMGGPLFLSQYSFLGLDPRGLRDRYADYWRQNVAHTRINREHCVRNPGRFKGYGPDCWGLTASDSPLGYEAHSPACDLGVITPSAALSAYPYAPEHALAALRHFHNRLGDRIWGEYGFVDAFSESADWYAGSHLAIDQGPIVVMIENGRTGLLWSLFMSCPEIREGLRRLGFESPHLAEGLTS